MQAELKKCHGETETTNQHYTESKHIESQEKLLQENVAIKNKNLFLEKELSETIAVVRKLQDKNESLESKVESLTSPLEMWEGCCWLSKCVGLVRSPSLARQGVNIWMLAICLRRFRRVGKVWNIAPPCSSVM